VALSSAPVPGSPGAHHWVDGSVLEREFLGEFVRYRVSTGALELIVDQQHTLGDAGYAPGTRISVGVDPGQLRVLQG
jgi:hypothetical protein